RKYADAEVPAARHAGNLGEPRNRSSSGDDKTCKQAFEPAKTHYSDQEDQPADERQGADQQPPFDIAVDDFLETIGHNSIEGDALTAESKNVAAFLVSASGYRGGFEPPHRTRLI